jgi:hypothetical protein
MYIKNLQNVPQELRWQFAHDASFLTPAGIEMHENATDYIKESSEIKDMSTLGFHISGIALLKKARF